ncbi:MAG: hypothetical protein V4492_05670, partial [Chlamydiota bacterium]
MLNKTALLCATLALPFAALSAETEAVPISFPSIKMEKNWREKMLAKTLKGIDQFLSLCVGESLKGYALLDSSQDLVYEFDNPHLREFSSTYGFLSPVCPLVGRVSSSADHFEIAHSLLQQLQWQHEEFSELAIAEILTKVLAYRDLEVGQVLRIPNLAGGQLQIEEFVVDRIFDLWRGMPAFGLLPTREGVHAILLFRGTDLSLDSQRGWASVMSDLDWNGPGLGAFRRAQQGVHEWLAEVHGKNRSAKAMGFSLGGALAAYTFIYENEWLAETGSLALNAPGVSDAVVCDWESVPAERQRGFRSYVNEGDIVSKVGKLFGEVYQLSTGMPLKPLTAHTALMCSKPFVVKSRVDVAKENQ